MVDSIDPEEDAPYVSPQPVPTSDSIHGDPRHCDPIHIVKSRARILRKQAIAGEPDAIARIQRSGAFQSEPLSPLTADERAQRVKHRHSLAVIAQELGFENWTHALRVLCGDETEDFGKLLYPYDAGHWNIWCASYNEAKQIHQQHRGYLLAYGRQFLVVDRHFIDSLGVDPDDPDWERIAHDWVRPSDGRARRRLYARVIEAWRGGRS